MPQATYQTIKLGKGKHSSPRYGACVMELASMLAGEPFSDHPPSVSPSLGSLLRTYNDTIDDVRRQDLYEYASKVVGTAASAEVEQARQQLIIEWANGQRENRPGRSALGLFRIPRRRGIRQCNPEHLGHYAIEAIGKISDDGHAAVLALVDRLIELEDGVPAVADRARPEPDRRLVMR